MERVGNHYGEVTRVLSEDGHTVMVHMGMGYQTVSMENVLCEDGKERTVYVREADTFFTAPGRISAYGKTITGFVSYVSGCERWTFTATGKYKDFLLEKAPK